MALSVSMVICEKILQELDGIPSAIRIADFIGVRIVPELSLEQQPAHLFILITVRELSEHIPEEFPLQLRLTRPSGSTHDVGIPTQVKLQRIHTVAPKGFNAGIGLGIIPHEQGIHYVSVLLNNEEVARSPITVMIENSRPPSQEHTASGKQ